MAEIYRFQVKGRLDKRWSDCLGGLAIQIQEDGATVLVGPVVDQAALYGLIAQIRDLGLSLLAVNLVSASHSSIGSTQMNTTKQLLTMEMKAKLSTLWIFVLFNITFRDIHEFLKPGFIEEVMTGVVNGNQLTDELFLIGGIMIEVPIAMVLLSRLLKYGVNRWANIIAGVTTIGFVIADGATDLDDIFFAIIEVTALALVIWHAWKWPNLELSAHHRIQAN